MALLNIVWSFLLRLVASFVVAFGLWIVAVSLFDWPVDGDPPWAAIAALTV